MSSPFEAEELASHMISMPSTLHKQNVVPVLFLGGAPTSICHFFHLSAHLSVCQYVCWPVCSSVHLSICPSVMLHIPGIIHHMIVIYDAHV